MTLNILNVNDTLDLKIGGGTAERTFQMSRFLARQGAVCNVLTINSEMLDASRITALNPAKVYALACFWRRFNFPIINWKMISRLVDQADIIHLMGHWSILNAVVYFAIRRTGKPYVVCPAGALPLFGRSKIIKRIYNWIVGYAIIRNASGWIAVTEAEFSQFEAYGVHSARVTIIPNGVSRDDFPIVNSLEVRRRYGLSDAPIILFMGRLNLIKGPDLLLEAFLMARHSFPEYHLVFAGPDGGLMANLRVTVEQAGMNDIVHFLGYVGGADKSAIYRMASLLVVPSRQEAMSIVAIEAGICGVPVLLTDQCGFSEICEVDVRLEVPASVDGLANGLSRLLADAKCLEVISPLWLSLVDRKYSWSSLVPKYINLYENILKLAIGR
jgi:glycosyltransferase involved in cell wall biosynthesis